MIAKFGLLCVVILCGSLVRGSIETEPDLEWAEDLFGIKEGEIFHVCDGGSSYGGHYFRYCVMRSSVE